MAVRRTRSQAEPAAGPATRGPDSPVTHGLGAGFEWLALAFALAGGILLLAVMGMTVASVLGRYFFGTPVPGDYELTELACGIAVFAFFPYCHVTNANVVVEFFTSGLRPRHRAALDSLHSIVFTIMASVIAWRLFVGAARKLQDGETTLFLEIPVYWAYIPALVAAGLLSAVGLLVIHRRLRSLRR